MSGFHPVVKAWFEGRFEGPTGAQAQGWESIAQGKHTLISAPTGSGKTLAAFLKCIDDLIWEGLDSGLEDVTQIVYVSPLKALSNDIERNLAGPLAEITAKAEEMGIAAPEIRVGLRTGDTKASQRQSMAKRPPHILITTPESLYILLTSKSGRQGLRGVKTLIVDEIHAVADDKRGSHLSLSMERLCALAEGPVTRIGLSATQRPIEEVARFLVGNAHIDEKRNPDCLIVNAGHARKIDLAIEMPGSELGPIASHELWAETLDRVVELAEGHETTLVFVNTRRLVERVAHQLTERLGEEAIAAHHGSMSRERRFQTEQALKTGKTKICVATASLELGIDVGLVDLVCQIGSPRSIGLLMQRVGRSGHTIKGTPKGRMFPLTRDELVECIALARAVRRQNLDTLSIPSWPLDVLAQQIVAGCVAEEWDEDELFEVVRRAYPYRDLPRKKYDEVVKMLAEGVAPREGRRTAHLHRDGVGGKLKGRRGARIPALTSGGAIPDTADYDVVADPEGVFVGTVNEDFAIESMAGDIFLLGNTPWRIRRVESGRVRVEDAQGLPPSIPFWLGEAPGRTWELSEEITELRNGIEERLGDNGKAEGWVTEESGVGGEAARQVVEYLDEGRRVLGGVPSGNKIFAERFFDESGGTQVVIHSPLGARVNRAWGMALRKQICRSFDFELQAAATDDGINFSLGPNLSFPLEELFSYLSTKNVEKVLTQAALQAPLFQTRWRWNATRALAIIKFSGGKKVPAPLVRMRSDDLLASVFPAQVQCQDNAPTADIEVPDHPLVFETVRDCLTEAMDLEGLTRLLGDIERGAVEVFARDTPQPSVFSHQILNAMPYAFLDDAPLEERRSRAVSLRRALPEDSRDLASLDPEAIAAAAEDAWPPARDADEMHDLLLSVGLISDGEIAVRYGNGDGGVVTGWLEGLLESGRVTTFRRADGSRAWVAVETVREVMPAYPEAELHPIPPERFLSDTDADPGESAVRLVRGRTEVSGPQTAEEIGEMLALPEGTVKAALAQLESEGQVLRGSFRPGLTGEEYCDRRILARIHRATVSRLRREIEPVSESVFMRFLLRWQHVEPDRMLSGESGLIEVIEQLQGFEAAAGAWEPHLLKARVAGYEPSMLDDLCFGGEVMWGRMIQHRHTPDQPISKVGLTRNGPITLGLRENLDWLLDPTPEDDQGLGGAARDILNVLTKRGASFQSDIAKLSKRLPSEVKDGLWQLVAAGRATADGFTPLRHVNNGPPPSMRRSTRLRRRARNRPSTTRWSLLQPLGDGETSVTERAFQLLRRYGVVFYEMLAREPMAPPWRELVRIYRQAEAQGKIRGGRFISGHVGEQFALPEAIEMLRSTRKQEGSGRYVQVSACDPMNLVGIISPGARVPAAMGNLVVYQNGVAVASVEGGRLNERSALPRSAKLEVLGMSTAGRSGRRMRGVG